MRVDYKCICFPLTKFFLKMKTWYLSYLQLLHPVLLDVHKSFNISLFSLEEVSQSYIYWLDANGLINSTASRLGVTVEAAECFLSFTC